MKRFVLSIFSLLSFLIAWSFEINPTKNFMVYTPAKIWEETLPLGDCRLGMMPDGGIEYEKMGF